MPKQPSGHVSGNKIFTWSPRISTYSSQRENSTGETRLTKGSTSTSPVKGPTAIMCLLHTHTQDTTSQHHDITTSQHHTICDIPPKMRNTNLIVKKDQTHPCWGAFVQHNWLPKCQSHDDKAGLRDGSRTEPWTTKCSVGPWLGAWSRKIKLAIKDVIGTIGKL